MTPVSIKLGRKAHLKSAAASFPGLPHTMATYFTPAPTSRRAHSDAAPTRANAQRPPLDTSSILIFPSPPTAQSSSVPPSPYEDSLSSVPTDLSLPSDSGYSLSRRTSSRGPGPGRSISYSRSRSVSYSRSRLSSSWEDVGEEDDLALWPSHSRNDSEWEREQYFERVIQPQLVARARTLSSATSSKSSTLPDPHPPVHIPLLDLFRRLLLIDEDDETVQLLTRASTSSHSHLFDASPYAGGVHAGDRIEEETRLEEERACAARVCVPYHETDMLKHGLAVYTDEDRPIHNPFAPSLSLWSLITLVADVVGSGGKLLSTSWRSKPPVPPSE
ncbi:hypothetical protein EXIGLDRAFT_838870 [Exidia glandulosa HHB12029]|uniref:Uncharacterized protein n=1 Tax=Exidia glandulosa HHB12029 TaxID=1314781 RepID=A0A165FGD5_EXIGL|nr:hypothetical protein EXIGLDRAFT_838870 [Exidia glandulosa HHB12029]